jgi:hypothetical protein
MDNESYSLSNLRDIVVPDAPAFWPPAPGMWVALVLVVLALLFALWRVYTTGNRNAYRRAGLLLLGDAKTAHDVSVIMKRVALAAFPREQVASLYGEEWVAFLRTTCPRGRFPETITTDAGAEPDPALVALAGTWIRQHRVPESGTPFEAR